MKTLVTFLGRGRENRDTGYRETTYEFPDGSKTTTAFFGPALAKHINANRIVILGTKSSQWGVLVENLAAEGEEEDARLDLMEAETEGVIEQKHLEKVVVLIKKAVGCEIVPCLIPFGKNESDQYKILDAIAENVKEGTVDFDLTHGFRHFGMIGFLSTFMLAHVRDLNVNNLWYGALDMTQDGITPVLKLEGLDRVRQWVDALNRFDATGNYRVFGPLLTKDGVEKNKAKHLEKAAFYERTLNLTAAAVEIRNFIPVLKSNLTGASGLFQKRLAERLTWVNLDKLSKQQAELARRYLKRRDYVRAALFGWESLVSQECENQKADPNDRQERAAQNVLTAVDNWPLREGQESSDNREACQYLNQIRNAFAHGTSPNNKEVRKMLKDEVKLNEGLKKIFDCLLPN
jgi:CRISPR-associated Csx2 family protein